MKGTTILLLGAATLVAYASAHPYSKIEEGSSRPDEYHIKRSSSNSNSNSYSQLNHDETDVDGAFGGKTFSASKSSGYSTSGSSHSQSSSFASSAFNGNIPPGILGGSSFSGLAQNPSTYGQSSLAIGNPGTAGLGLSDKASGFTSGSYSTSYGTSGAGPGGSSSPGGQIIGGGQGLGLSGSHIGAGIESIGFQGGNLGSNSGIYQSAGGASFEDSHTPIAVNFGESGSGYFQQTGSQPGAVQYWWNGADSPFGPDGKPSGGCNSNACALAGNFDLSKGAGGAHASNQGGQVGVKINSGNPFFAKGQADSGSGFISSGASYGQSGIASGSGFGAGAGGVSGSGSHSRPIDASKNPFFDGSYSAGSSGSGSKGGSGSFASSNAGASSGSAGSGSFGSFGSSGSFIGAGNPFLKPGSGAGHIPEISGQTPTAIPGYTVSQGHDFGNVGVDVGSHNPFFKPGSGSVVITSPVSVIPDQSQLGFSHSTPLPDFPIQSITPTLAPQLPTVLIPSSSPSSGFESSTPGYHGSLGSFGSAGAGDFQQQEGQVPSFPSQSTIDSGSFLAGYTTPSTFIIEQKPSGFDDGFTVSCSGEGRICVLKERCVNGRVNANEQGLLQVKNGPQLCKVDREVCCTLNIYSGSTTNFGGAQNSGFSSSGSSSSSISGSRDEYSGVTGTSARPGVTGGYGQSTGSPGTQGQFGQFGSTNNYGQSGNNDQSLSSGSSGIFGQTGQFGSAGSYDQSQQKETIGFGPQSNTKSSSGSNSNFGNQGVIGFTPGFSSGSSLGTPAPSAIGITPGFGFRKPTISGSAGGNSGFASAIASANSDASGQAGSSVSGGYVHPSSTPSSQGVFSYSKRPSQSNGGLFGSADNSGEDLSAGEPGYTGSSNGIKGSAASNGYLPPVGSLPSDNVPAFAKPPAEDVDQSTKSPAFRPSPPRPTAFVPAPIPVQVGCAAALICVEEKFCTLEGVISPEPVALTSQQLERRVPLSSCKNPDNGVIGKCCRDPNYVDPWPTGNLPANYSGGFDEQGFPTYLNIAKTRPPKKQTPLIKGGFQPSIKGSSVGQKPTDKGFIQDFFGNLSFPTFPTGFPSFPTLSNIPGFPFTTPSSEDAGQSAESSEIPQKPSESVESGAPFPSFPADVQVTQKPGNTVFGVSFPPINIPNPFENFGSSKNYDSSATSQSPTVIAPHTPGAQCGLRNKVQRPSGLDRDDVAFGEIPWQAMVLSTKERKLLCSGAIVAPNAVLTAAHCVAGFKPEDVSIKSGEWKLGYELKHEEPLPFEIVKVSNIVSHPGFQPGSLSHDLAILFLEHPVKLDQHVDILCLGDIPQPKPGRKCIATGWGKIVLQVNAAGSLMHGIDVDLVPQDECKYRLQGAESQIEVDNTMTCVKPQNQRNNMCQVDVGGPLACDRGDGYYELTGIYIEDTGCLPTNQVATFALIDTNWVKQILQSPPRPTIPSYEVTLPNLGESPSPSSVQTQFGAHVHQPAATCDCQKSNLPPELNQYLPPV